MKKQCKIINIKTIDTVLSSNCNCSGSLSFFESISDIPFVFKRFYYITGVKSGVTRGFHAHKCLKQFIFCPFGSVELYLEDEYGKDKIVLNNPSIGVFIDHPVWREMKWLIDNSVLCVMASDYYDESDYIRNYNDFIDFISKKREKEK